MNQEKLKGYTLTGSIHTFSIKSPGIVSDVMSKVANCIEAKSQTKDGLTTTSIINPNKLIGDVFSFDQFKTVSNTILAGANIDNYHFVRVDMRFDSYDPSHYKAYMKLNRYLISALAVTYKVKNTYRTNNLFTQEQLSVAIKNDYFEAENYDREAKSNLTGNTIEPAKSRLEERSTSRQWRHIYSKSNKDLLIDNLAEWNMQALKKEFTETWFERWDNSLDNLDLVQKTYNDELEKLYNANKNAYPCRFRTMTDFILQYQDCIFTKAQLIDLYARLGAENPVTKAKNYKQMYGIEFFSKADVKRAIQEIKRATNDFFDDGTIQNAATSSQNEFGK